jgi:hypothetical protein
LSRWRLSNCNSLTFLALGLTIDQDEKHREEKLLEESDTVEQIENFLLESLVERSRYALA